MTRAIINPDLKHALAGGTPVEVFDPSTNEVDYLVSAEQFRGITALAGGNFDPRAAYPMIDQISAEDDAADPLLGSYQ
jgi:hypothetical protein